MCQEDDQIVIQSKTGFRADNSHVLKCLNLMFSIFTQQPAECRVIRSRRSSLWSIFMLKTDRLARRAEKIEFNMFASATMKWEYKNTAWDLRPILRTGFNWSYFLPRICALTSVRVVVYVVVLSSGSSLAKYNSSFSMLNLPERDVSLIESDQRAQPALKLHFFIALYCKYKVDGLCQVC